MKGRTTITLDLVKDARAGLDAAREELGRQLLHLGNAIAWRTGARGADLEDLRQAGAVAALEALLGSSWHPARGDPSSYAYRVAARAISSVSLDLKSPASLGRRGRRERREVVRARRRLEQAGELPTGGLTALGVQRIAAAAGVSEEAVIRAVGTGPSSGASGDRRSAQALPECGREEDRSDRRLRGLMNGLTPRQQQILELWLSHSLTDAAAHAGVSRARVSAVAKEATSRLRQDAEQQAAAV
jgi:RNA polymerase sigma factor (sigma-70 family)